MSKLILVLPHSNVEERVFSMVRKNKTAFRPSLDPKGGHLVKFVDNQNDQHRTSTQI